MIWSIRESNPWPLVYKTNALPTEPTDLNRQWSSIVFCLVFWLLVMVHVGLEPTTSCV